MVCNFMGSIEAQVSDLKVLGAFLFTLFHVQLSNPNMNLYLIHL